MNDWIFAINDCLDMLADELLSEGTDIKGAMIISSEIDSLKSLRAFVQGYLYASGGRRDA